MTTIQRHETALREGVTSGESPAATTGASGKRVGGTSVLGAVLSSFCCLTPMLALALGLGGASFATGLQAYRWYFIVIGMVIAALATWWNLRRSRACCSPQEYRRNRVLWPLLTVGSFAASYGFINLILAPWIERLMQ